MTENDTKNIIKEWHCETKYPSGATKTIKIELFADGQLIKTEKGDFESSVTFIKKYKRLSYAKKKLNSLRDEYLGYSP